MKIERRKTKENGIIQVTTQDERFYYREKDDKYVPSSTWIAGHYPKGVAFYKWLASKGWDEAEAIKTAAGEKGSKVHHAIESLLFGNVVLMNSLFTDGEGLASELTPEEYECVMSFAEWFNLTKPEIIHTEQVVWNDEYNYAGTVDLVCKIDGEVWVVDFKTSASIWAEYELQISSYKHALPYPDAKLGILQVGYKYNKNKKWKFTEVPDKFDLFLHARAIWENECEGIKPLQKDYPPSLKLNIGK